MSEAKRNTTADGRTKGPFVQTPVWWLDLLRASLPTKQVGSALHVLLTIAERADFGDGTHAWWTDEKIAETTGLSVATVERYRGVLGDLGIISWTVRLTEDGRKFSDFTVNWYVEDATPRQDARHPVAGGGDDGHVTHEPGEVGTSDLTHDDASETVLVEASFPASTPSPHSRGDHPLTSEGDHPLTSEGLTRTHHQNPNQRTPNPITSDADAPDPSWEDSFDILVLDELHRHPLTDVHTVHRRVRERQGRPPTDAERARTEILWRHDFQARREVAR
jgi:hypothetical protein